MTQLDYHIASHYDADHIGCSDHVLARWPIKFAFDRGTFNPPATQTYMRYVAAVPPIRRVELSVGYQIVLDSGSEAPVILEVVAVNGNGTAGSLTENDRSIVIVLHFGYFDAVFGGDLSGDPTSSVHNIEGQIAGDVGQVEVYKVHHHGSATSSSTAWMNAIHPKVATLSMGSPNAYDHPTQAALDRIRVTGATTYWTTSGDGAAAQPPYDVVSNGPIRIITTEPGIGFTVIHGDFGEGFPSWHIDRHTRLDLEDDRRTDLAIYRPSTGTWYIRYSMNDYSIEFPDYDSFWWGGQPDDMPLAGDFDGDGGMDLTIYRPSNGTWFIAYLPHSGKPTAVFQWGLPDDVPVVGDFDGDLKADLTVYRPSTGTWYVRYSSLGYTVSNYGAFQWGIPGDIPMVGDFDADGRTDITIYRPATGTWYIRYSSTGFDVTMSRAFQWGVPDDIPLTGYFDGDGYTDLAIYRPSSGAWFICYSSKGYSSTDFRYVQWGLADDLPLLGDFDADGRAEIAVYRPSTGQWFILLSSMAYHVADYRWYQWGAPDDMLIR